MLESNFSQKITDIDMDMDMDMDMDNMDNHHKENLMNIVHEEDPAIL